MVLIHKNVQQALRFCCVGLCAALAHMAVLFLLVDLNYLQPLWANVVAFILAFQVSYWGHSQWTFEGDQRAHRIKMAKLFLVASMSFMLNETAFFVLLTYCHLPYLIATFIVLSSLACVNFILNKTWVFRLANSA